MKSVKYIGLDVHKKMIAIAIADAEGEVRSYGMIACSLSALDRFRRQQVSSGCELRFVYEAGPCGYGIYRHLRSKGFHCEVVAPALIPRKPGERIKNDRRDAVKLARLYRAGELAAIYVPDPQDEAMRDLTRAREDACLATRKAKQRLKSFLLRHGQIFTGRSPWSNAYWNWLAAVSMPHAAQQIVLQEYIDAVQESERRVQRLTEQIRQLLPQWRFAPLVEALQAMRGVSLIVAVTTVAELGDLSRFDSAEKLMAFLGLVPQLYASGDTIRSGPITKAGNGHVRRVLVEAAWAYRLPARISGRLRQRQHNIAEPVRQIAWKAQLRLCARFRQMAARKKLGPVIATAIARELSAFMWDIAKHVTVSSV
jgi:transposase